jgi:hypothetical protein
MNTKCGIGKAGIGIIPNNGHMTLAMFALAFLTVVKVAGQKRGPFFRSTKSSNFSP